MEHLEALIAAIQNRKDPLPLTKRLALQMELRLLLIDPKRFAAFKATLAAISNEQQSIDSWLLHKVIREGLWHLSDTEFVQLLRSTKMCQLVVATIQNMVKHCDELPDYWFESLSLDTNSLESKALRRHKFAARVRRLQQNWSKD